MKIKRIEQEEAYIQEAQNVTIEELCEKFGVSKNTIRRDLIELERKGSIVKNYGGVSSAVQSYDVGMLPFNARGRLMREEKQRIAERAAEFIKDGDYIFVDSGSTVCNLVDFIKTMNVTVLTNNLDFIIRALPYPNIQIITFSGILNRDYYSFTSIDERSAEILSSYNFTKAFMAATGVTVQYGAMNSLLSDNQLKTTAVNRAQEVYLLVDHTKFGKVTIKSYGSLEQIDTIITDEPPADEILESIQQCGCEIIVVS
ncbi:MAG: DeoR/GlpR transcriptional regulator [Lachnospiraceae bacterium]|jgi:DeoR family myo-inositol catabolism operon transcriptional repressor|nr:DeoR/GlpR transcriptional regulator [Lachnospiraceae bacterium]